MQAEDLLLRFLPADVDPDDESASTPLLVGGRELAALLRIGLRTLRSMDAAGKMPRPVRISHSVRWSLAEIRDWIDAGAPDRETWTAIRAVR